MQKQGFEAIWGELRKLVNEIVQSSENRDHLKNLVLENKSFIKNNARLILDVALIYSLNDFFFLLLEEDCININQFNIKDLHSLINKNIILFQFIFEHLKNTMSKSDFSNLDYEIKNKGYKEFKTYFSNAKLPMENLNQSPL